MTRLGCRLSLTRQKYSPESTERTGAMWRLKLVEERYIRSGALRITVPSWLYETSLDAVLFLDPPLPLPKPLYSEDAIISFQHYDCNGQFKTNHMCR